MRQFLYPDRAGRWRKQWFRRLPRESMLVIYFLEDGIDAGGFTKVDWRKVGAALSWTQREFKAHTRPIPTSELLESGDWFWRPSWFEEHWPPSEEAIFDFFAREAEFNGFLEYRKVYSELRDFRPPPPAVDPDELTGSPDFKRAVGQILDVHRYDTAYRDILMRWWLYRAEAGKPPGYLQWSQFLAMVKGWPLDRLTAAIHYSIAQGYTGLQEGELTPAETMPAAAKERPTDTKTAWRPIFKQLYPGAEPPPNFWCLNARVQKELCQHHPALQKEIDSYRTK